MVTAAGSGFCRTMVDAIRETGLTTKHLLNMAINDELDVSPFSETLVNHVRAGFDEVLEAEGVVWLTCKDLQQQTMVCGLLGKMIKAIGDPGWEVMSLCESGVRLGAGASLPRTPDVYSEKTRWALPGQKEASPEDLLEGAWLSNYASAADHMEEVAAVLEDQVARGQVLKLTEYEALKRYGKDLQIAARGAVAKETRPDGSTAVRIVHDGTHGVGGQSGDQGDGPGHDADVQRHQDGNPDGCQ